MKVIFQEMIFVDFSVFLDESGLCVIYLRALPPQGGRYYAPQWANHTRFLTGPGVPSWRCRPGEMETEEQHKGE